MNGSPDSPDYSGVDQVVSGGESAAGHDLGAFDVDANGQATYRLPVTVPPGINGAQPDLALVYHHRLRNGALGVGWDVAGRSAITRVKANYAVDGFNGAVRFGPDDRLALDGRRLIAVDGVYHTPGAVYETELRSYERVVAGSTPGDGFRSTTRSGTVREYGATPDSLVPAGGDVLAWALSATEDLDGNRVEYRYTGSPDGSPAGSGSRYLQRIAYTARADGTAANRFVDFAYERRPDPVTQAVGGRFVNTDFRLTRITVSVGDEVVRTYTIGYGQSTATGLSVITSVTESGAAADGSPSLPATLFTWQDAALPRFDVGGSYAIGPAVPGAPDIMALTMAGSGRSDLARFWTDEVGNLGVSTYLATRSGAYAHVSDDVLGAFGPQQQVIAADLDGDGRTDLVVAYADGPLRLLRLAVFRATGTGFARTGEPFDTGTAWDSTHLQFFAMDVNGDGCADIVHAVAVHDPQRGEVLQLRPYLSGYGAGGTFTAAAVSTTEDPARPVGELGFWPIDVNGDGMVDLARVWRDGANRLAVAAYVATGTGVHDVSLRQVVRSELAGYAGDGQVALLPVDVNGDGVQDLVQVWEERDPSGGVTSHLSVLLSDGAGGFVPGEDSEFPGAALSDGRLFAMDLNGNASTALLWQSQTADQILFTPFVASPAGAFRQLPSFGGGPAGLGPDQQVFLPVDVNGDGRADLVRLTPGPDGQVLATPYLSSGAPLDVITGITTPLGERVTIDYAPLSDPDVYTASGTARFPAATALRPPGPLTPTSGPVQRVIGAAVYVVSAYEESTDPARNRFAYRHRRRLAYRDGLVDLSGRGWLGFAARTMLDEDTGRQTTSEYRQDFPFTGALSAVRVTATPVPGGDPRVPAGSPPLLLSTTTFTHDSRRSGPAGTVAEVLVTATRQEHYDYGADRFDYALAHRFAYDEYGNQTLDVDLGYVQPDTGAPVRPAEVVYRRRRYDNAVTPAGWSLGHLRYDKVSRNADDPDITVFAPGDYSLRRYDLAPGTYHVVADAVWDDVSAAFLTTAYEYDRFGNPTAATPPGSQATRHEYDPDYHTYRSRTVRPPDGQGVSLVECFGYDPRFGSLVAHADPDGQIRVVAADAFGRPALRQEPADDGGVTDPNAVPACVTGTAQARTLFRAAAVVTVEQINRYCGAPGEQVIETSALQAFPTGEGRSRVATRTLVDGRDRARRTVHESGQRRGDVVALVDYDADGRRVRQSLPFFAPDPSTRWILTRYDVLGRPIRHDVPAGDDGDLVSTTTWFHGPRGVVTETTGAGTPAAYVRRLVHRRYAGADRVRLVVADPDGLDARTVFEFDPLGRLVRAVDPPTATNPGGVATTLAYDSLGRHVSYDCPDLNPAPPPGRLAVRYEYDPKTGLLDRRTDAAGGRTDFGYDHLGRVVTQRLADGRTVEREYDLADDGFGRGRLGRVTVHDQHGAVQSQRDFGYDRRGDTARTTLTVAGEPSPYTTTAVFDPQRRAVRRTLPDGTVETSTYAFNRLVGQTLGDARVDRPLEDHDPFGLPLTARYGHPDPDGEGFTRSWTRSPVGAPRTEQITGPGGRVLDVGYAHDLLGRTTAVTDALDPRQSQEYGYRQRQLSRFRRGSGEQEHYEYDHAGNLRGKDGVSYDYYAHFARGGTRDGDPVYRATQDACGRTATRVADGTELRFDYDGFGALRGVTAADGSPVLTVVTDEHGRVLRRTSRDGTTEVVVDGGYRIVREPGGEASTERWLLAGSGAVALVSGPADAPVTTYFRRDPKGSTTHVLDPAGRVLSQVGYDPFGQWHQVLGAVPPQRAFENRRWLADVGLYDFGGRYYDPVRGRFLTPDPGAGATDPYRADALNRFAFELDDPIDAVDPSGYLADWAIALIVGGAAVGLGLGIVLSGGALAAALPGLAAATGMAFLATDTAAAVVTAGVSAIGWGVLSGGLAAVNYAVGHRDVSGARFWEGLAVNVAVSAAAATIAAGLGSAVSLGMNGLLASDESIALGSIPGFERPGIVQIARALLSAAPMARQGLMIGVNTAYGAVAGAAVSVTQQVTANGVDQAILGRHVGLATGLANAALLGGVTGAARGLVSSSADSFLPRTRWSEIWAGKITRDPFRMSQIRPGLISTGPAAVVLGYSLEKMLAPESWRAGE